MYACVHLYNCTGLVAAKRVGSSAWLLQTAGSCAAAVSAALTCDMLHYQPATGVSAVMTALPPTNQHASLQMLLRMLLLSRLIICNEMDICFQTCITHSVCPDLHISRHDMSLVLLLHVPCMIGTQTTIV
jgi:hypothetical protein